FEDVMNIVERERPRGVIVQFGGQTPLKLTMPLTRAGVPILGTPPDAIDRAEDRRRFAELLESLRLQQAPGSTARSFDEAAGIAAAIGYPVLVRPSYVLGGRAMQIVYDEGDLRAYMTEAVRASPEHPIPVDKFLEDALEIDVDATATSPSAMASTSPTERWRWWRASWSMSRRPASTPATPPAPSLLTPWATTR